MAFRKSRSTEDSAEEAQSAESVLSQTPQEPGTDAPVEEGDAPKVRRKRVVRKAAPQEESASAEVASENPQSQASAPVASAGWRPGC